MEATNGVIKLLKKINPHEATGPYNIPARLLKKLAVSLGPMLTILYQASLDSGTLPAIWRSATVSPIFKKEDRNKPSNYRPISLTVICCKLLEHIIHICMMRHFDSCNILTDFQHVFRKARSCESQLMHHCGWHRTQPGRWPADRSHTTRLLQGLRQSSTPSSTAKIQALWHSW